MSKKVPQPKLFGPLWSVVFSIGIFFASQFWAAALITPFFVLAGGNTGQPLELLQSSAWLSFLYVLAAEAITLSIIYALIKIEQNADFTTLGLDKPKLKYILYAAGGLAAYFLIYIVTLIVAKMLIPGLDLEKEQEIGFQTSTQGLSLIPIFLSLVILAPVTEEIVARGFLFGGLRTKLPFIKAAVITSILFGAAHITQASDGLLWVAAIDTFILSMMLCFLREKTGSLWPAIGVHMLKNALAFVILFNILQYFR